MYGRIDFKVRYKYIHAQVLYHVKVYEPTHVRLVFL